MIEAGIFDVGGVLVHWDGKPLVADITTTLRIDQETFWQAWEKLIPLMDTGKITEDEFWKKFVSQTNSSQPLPDESLFLRSFRTGFQPNDEVLALVKDLKDEGYRLGVLSNTIEPHTKFLRTKGIYDSFDTLVFSDEVGLVKPDPAVYHLVLDRLKVEPSRAFFIDDKEENVAAANELGIHGIVFHDSGQLKNELQSLGVKV